MLESKEELNRNWQVFLVDNADLTGNVTCLQELEGHAAVPAAVPGDWPLDYVRAGLLKDCFERDQFLQLRAYETYHVFYGVRFRWRRRADENTFLLFEGIDTVADVYLNGRRIGHAENMFIPHEFPAAGLVCGENELLVHIKPVALEARKYPLAAENFCQKYNYESLIFRKAAHSFGWDIAPRLVSSGLWRPVSVIRKKTVRIEDAFVRVEHIGADGAAQCTLVYSVALADNPVKPYTVRIHGVCGDSRFTAQQDLWYVNGRVSFSVTEPKLWWPANYGDANQYEVTVSLLENGKPVDTLSFRQGLRTAELKRDDLLDARGNGDFCFVINGKRIFILGTNWVPADAFHSNDGNRIPDILNLVKDIGCNALRVWGGGVYESDAFYNWCDANGIVVWQDFMMACGVYPHTGRMQSQLREEAVAIVRRLRRHACICLWAGDNECDQSYCWYDCPVDPTLNLLTRKVLPAVLRQEDLSRPYLPSSPYVSHEAFATGRAQDTPEQHLWGPRDYFKGHFYRDHTAVFASEIGYHGCNSPQSLIKFIGPDKLWPVERNPLYLYHAASPELEDSPTTYRIGLMTNQLRTLFQQEPRNIGEYARMSQISQAEAKKFFIESFRCRKGRRTGIIWWNIMDCWPQISDAVVDYYFCKKLAYYYIRRSQQPVCLMMADDPGKLTLYGVSELQRTVSVRFTVTDADSGQTVLEQEAALPADTAVALASLPGDDGAVRFYSIEWTTSEGGKGGNHYLQGKPPYDFHWYMRCLQKTGYDEFEGF